MDSFVSSRSSCGFRWVLWVPLGMPNGFRAVFLEVVPGIPLGMPVALAIPMHSSMSPSGFLYVLEVVLWTRLCPVGSSGKSKLIPRGVPVGFPMPCSR